MGMNLFDDSDDIEEISKIKTNTEFAKRYEHNKKREELQRLEELKKKGLAGDSEDDSSESDDIDDDFISGKNDLGFFEALVKIKNKDPIIYQKDAKFFESESEEEESEEGENPKPKKGKKYLKDVIAKNLIEDGADLYEEKDSKFGIKSYSEEQDEYRKAVLEASEGVFGGEDGDLLIEKKINGGEDEGDDGNDEVHLKIGEYFGDDEKLEEDEKFLKDFVSNKAWSDKNKGKKPYNEDLDPLSDEEEYQKAENYEAVYNHRFEEGAGDRVLGHARFTEGSVRKKDNARKLQRKSKEERMAQAEFERKEELKHMKNLKKKEIQEKLEKIRAIAGIPEGETYLFNKDDLEEDFDPEEYDRKMKETFDVDYYDKDDVDPDFGNDDDDLEKPDFDKEDELLGLSKDWDVCGSVGDGFEAAREKILQRRTENKDIDIPVDTEVEEELPGESRRKRKRKIPLREKVALDDALEEYYKLDYEDTIGDLKTRFKYTSVPSQRYGLNKEEILLLDEKELNQYVPLKKLAPYREKEWKVPNSKRYALKMKSKSLGKGENSKDQKPQSKHKRKSDGSSNVETGPLEEGKTQTDESMSRRSKRRRRQADLKLSHSRLIAYGINKRK